MSGVVPSPAEVIAEALRTDGGCRCSNGQSYCSCGEWLGSDGAGQDGEVISVILAALSEHGYSVVRFADEDLRERAVEAAVEAVCGPVEPNGERASGWCVRCEQTSDVLVIGR